MSASAAREPHPAFGLNDRATIRRLPGRQPEGIEAASISTVQGRDGAWYFGTGFSTATLGSFRPITHSGPYESERVAVEVAATEIRDRAAELMVNTSPGISSADHDWARRIHAWAIEQLAPQQEQLPF